ncbi:aminoglycoside phosphotransferase [Bacillus coahuilensis p1.1.43]|uniref:Aminoglycoside phosphotransferase n=1 Tax=Bacillus coahuilensis p1.1.43 TaxID=1150625 RepID=A0A147KB53_9BACI|nr:phosphotransferase family protein [Bacillus coahuilensis]KUP08105.1 aminoglycoside phosphotransferase [Bacillus coahuilensis p1.1.43]
MTQLIPVRQGEEIDTRKLQEFVTENLQVPHEELEIQQFASGASNLTYSVRIGEWEAVLRRPPLGPVAPKAHDMEREFLLLQSIHPTFPVAPKPLVFSKDETIVGAPFFLMERRHGYLFDTSYPKEVTPSHDTNRMLSKLMVDNLVKLHGISYKGTKLEELSKPEGFMERQVKGWLKRYDRSQTDDIKEVEPLRKWLLSNIPHTEESTVIHYDYKLNNALFSQDVKEMVGLFDWEMSTVGDPLADVGAAMSYWMEPADPKLLVYGLGQPTLTIQKGFYTRAEFIDSYGMATGRDMSKIHYYTTFATFKLAVICQQIYYRYQKGQTTDERFQQFNQFVRTLIQHAEGLAEKGGIH